MKKKILPVFLAIIIFFSSCIMQVSRTNAAVGAGALAGTAAGSAAGIAAGPWIIAGLIIAAGGALIIGASDEDIRNKAVEIWDRTSDGFKEGLESAYNGTVTLSKSMQAELEGFSDDISDWLSDKIRQKEIDMFTDGKLKFERNMDSFHHFSSVSGLLYVNGVNQNYFSYYLWKGNFGTNIDEKITLSKDVYDKFYDATKSADISKITSILSSLGYVITVVPDVYVSPNADVIGNNFVDALQGVKEIDIPLDAWLAQAQTSTGQKVNVDTSTGAMTLPDGTIYEGDISYPWSIPKGKIGTFPDATLQNPSVPVDKVFEGDGTATKPGETTKPDEGTGGILQGLWDWLKGILQKILDAIKALAGLLGILALIEAIKTLLESFQENWNKKMDEIKGKPKSIDWKRLTVALGQMKSIFPFSIPWDFLGFISQFDVTPIAPKFDIKVDKKVKVGESTIPFKMDWTLDFKTFNVVAAACRWLLIIAFDIFLITSLRKFTPD